MSATLVTLTSQFQSSGFFRPVFEPALRPVRLNYLKTSVGGITNRQMAALQSAAPLFVGSESGLLKTQVEMYCSS
jgi:hypothetical protein